MLADIIGLAPGTFHTILVKHDGSVWSTGMNSNGRGKSFVKVIPSDATTAAVGIYYSVVLTHHGHVWASGKNTKGQLFFFDASATGRRTFSVVATIAGAMTVAAGGYHCMVLTREGRVWVMGWNKYGQLGDGSTSDRTRFFSTFPIGAKAVAAGDIHSMVLNHDGSIWATGRNYNGQLGDGTKADRSSFVKVISSGVIDVTAGKWLW